MDRFFGLDRVSSHDDNLELLITVYDSLQLSIYSEILRGAKIPYLAKERGSGGCVKIIAGYSMYGTDLFVLRENLEEAQALISFSVGDDGDTEENMTPEEES